MECNGREAVSRRGSACLIFVQHVILQKGGLCAIGGSLVWHGSLDERGHNGQCFDGIPWTFFKECFGLVPLCRDMNVPNPLSKHSMFSASEKVANIN